MSNSEKVQLVMVIILLLSVIRIIMKMPNKLRVIVIVIMLTLLAFNWYMIMYQEELVNIVRNFFNVGELRSNS